MHVHPGFSLHRLISARHASKDEKTEYFKMNACWAARRKFVKRIPFIEAELTLLSESESGRKSPLDLDIEGVIYRPHIVIGYASQREVIAGKGNIIVEE